MKKYVLDTNLYVRAFRDGEAAARLAQFYSTFAPAVFLSTVVLFELLVGARTPEILKDIEDSLARPLRRANRIVTPSHSAWDLAGKALARLAADEGLDLRSAPKSFVNDLLLAASCREVGAVLLTDNTADFERLRRVMAFEFAKPWPA